jgi:fumarate hydratase subunit beta
MKKEETMKKINVPLDEGTIDSLKAGEEVSASGVIYTARDQAHLRMCELIKSGQQLPFDIRGQVIYYCGPTPEGDNIIGACGPTTSSRMDNFTPLLLENGLKGMIGKGSRSSEVIEAIKKNRAIYLLAPAGAGAYLSRKVTSKECVAFPELGPEAVYKLEVKEMPLVVCVDASGYCIYN